MAPRTLVKIGMLAPPLVALLFGLIAWSTATGTNEAEAFLSASTEEDVLIVPSSPPEPPDETSTPPSPTR